MALLHTLGFIVNHPLNSQHKADALFRFLKWQIGSRLVPGPVVYNWVNGAKAIVRPGETGLTGNIYCGLHEFPDMAYVLHAVTPEDLFVDIGANVGSYTLLACAAKGARGYCFEPVPSTYARLLDNIRLNDLTQRVKALNIGLGETESELAFSSGDNCTNHVLAENEARTDAVKVRVLPLDTVLAGESPTIMKIDVEGFETSVLNGAPGVLQNPSLHSVIMELNGSGSRYGFNEEAILQKMLDYGFSTYGYEPFSRKLKPLQGKNNLGGNTLFLRNESMIQERIAHAEPILVGKTKL